ncbi:MAG: hypothetical protein WBG37_05420 [Desulfobacterales bacterium]
MNIAVCFKTIADYGPLGEQDWATDDRLRIDLSLARREFNCYDESALELALQLAEAQRRGGAGCELTALTVDGPRADIFLGRLLAAQYDRGVRIDADEEMDLRFNPSAVSLLISAFVQRIGGQQLLLLGTQGGSGENGQTGFLVAERLGWPCIRKVSDVRPGRRSGTIQVISRREEAMLEQTVALPAVLTIGNAESAPYLRVPTLKQRIAVRGTPIKVLSLAQLGLPAAQISAANPSLQRLFRPPPRGGCMFIDTPHPRDSARRLYQRYLAGRMVK